MGILRSHLPADYAHAHHEAQWLGGAVQLSKTPRLSINSSNHIVQATELRWISRKEHPAILLSYLNSATSRQLLDLNTDLVTMAVGRTTVKKALDQLKSTITSDDARTFSDTTLESVWQGAREIEREQGARLDLRFMRRIEPFLKSLESYASVIEVFCQGFSPMAYVWVELTNTRSLYNR